MKARKIFLQSLIFSGIVFCNLQSKAQNFQWANLYGGNANILEPDITTYSAAGIDYYYQVGSFGNTNAQFGSYTLNNSNSSAGQYDFDTYLVKHDANGNVLWAQTIAIGSLAEDYTTAVTCDENGNVYVSGTTYGTATFGTGSNSVTGISGNFIVKYNSSGVFQWLIEPGGQISNLEIDHSGSIIAIGKQGGSVWYHDPNGSAQLASSTTGSGDALLQKYSSNGALIFNNNYFGLRTSNLAIDPSNNIIVTITPPSNQSYSFGACATCNGNTNTNLPWDYEEMLVKFDSNGNAIWVLDLLLNGRTWVLPKSMDCDDEGNIFLGLSYQGISGASSGGLALPPTANSMANAPYDSLSLCLIKYNSAGVAQWAQVGTGPNYCWGPGTLISGVMVDDCGYVYVTGTYGGTSLKFNSTVLNATGTTSDPFFMKCLSSNGTMQWLTQLTNSTNQGLPSIAINSKDQAVFMCTGASKTFPNSINQTISVSNQLTQIGAYLYSMEGPAYTATITPTCGSECWGTVKINGVSGLLAPLEYSLNNSAFQSSNYFDEICQGVSQITVQGANGCTANQNVNIPSAEDRWPKHPITLSVEEAFGLGVEVDLADGYYMTGSFTKRIEFPHFIHQFGNNSNNIVLTNAAGYGPDDDGFLARYNVCGIDWAMRIGSGSIDDEYGKCIANYSSAILLGTNVNGPIQGGIVGGNGSAVSTSINGYNLTSGLAPGVKKGLIISLNPASGAINWVYVLGNNPDESTEITDIKVHSAGDILAVGNFLTTFSYTSGQHLSYGDWDPFILKLNQSGGYINSSHWGSPLEDRVYALDIENLTGSNYEIFTTGFVSYDKVFFPAGGVVTGATPGEMTDLFALRFANTLGVNSYRVHRSPGREAGRDIKGYPASIELSYLITGYYEELLALYYTNLATPPMIAPGFGVNNQDAFLAGFDNANDPFWIQPAIASGPFDGGEAITVKQTSVTNIGNYSASPTGPSFISMLAPTSGASDMDIYISKFDVITGTQMAMISQPGTSSALGYDIVHDGLALYNTGLFTAPGNLSFPGQAPLSPASVVRDAFMGRLDLNLISFYKSDLQEAIHRDNVQPGNPKEAEPANAIHFFPNPVSEQLNFRTSRKLDRLEIISADGKVVWIEENIEAGFSAIEMGKFIPGLYLIIAQSEGITSSFRIIKN